MPFTEMPLWVPAAGAGFNCFNISRALAAGLAFRPLADTIHDTLTRDTSWPAGAERRAGLTPEREAVLLAAARARFPSPP